MLGYELLGSGLHKVLILHDWLGSHDNWDPLLPYLDTDTFEYAFVDLRGYGLSKSQQGSYTTTEASEDLIEVLDYLGWTHFHLVGHSMTGQVGLKLISRIADRVKSYIAVTPTPATSSKLPSDMMEQMKQALDTREGRIGMMSMVWGDRLSEQWVKFKVDRWLSQSTTEAVKGYLDMFGSEDISAEIPNTAIDMLVVACEHDMDGYKPDDILRGFSHYENAEFATIEDSSHYPMQETPVLLASLMDGFWKRFV